MLLALLKKELERHSLFVYLGLALLFVIESCYWIWGRFGTIDHEIYFSLLFSVSFAWGSLPLLVISLAILLKDFTIYQKIRIPVEQQIQVKLMFITLISLFISILPSFLFMVTALVTGKSSYILLNIVLEVIARHFMMLFSLGLIQYLGMSFFKNKYAVPSFLLSVYGALAYMYSTYAELVIYSFPFLIPPTYKGFSLVSVSLFFGALVLILGALIFIRGKNKESLGE